MRRGRTAAAGLVAAALLAAAAVLPTRTAAQSSGAVPSPEADTASRATPGAAAAASGAGLSGEKLDNTTADVAAQLRCPVCRGQSVLESTATLSKEMQAEIRRRLAAGQSPEEVKSYFVSRYGEWILLKPPAHGFNLLVYLFPAAVLVVGFGLAVLFVRSRMRTEEADGGEPAPDDAGGEREPAASEPGGATGEGAPSGDLSDEERAWLERALRERQDAGTS